MSVSSIYVHWPFCKSKCPYCAFLSTPLRDEQLREVAEQRLINDVKFSVERTNIDTIKTIYFGGGTPSLMSAKTVYEIVNYLLDKYPFADDVEITLEANPATFDKQKILDFKKAGINRLSVGIQSFCDDNLHFLGRCYDAHQAVTAAKIASGVFENFSFDFMYGYQGQTLQDLEHDLQKAVDFGCKHISAYQLMFEENTPFYRKLQKGELVELSEKAEVEQYNFIESFLSAHGIIRYEISNYSIPSFESRHNLAYWRYDDYLGIGAGAHSRITIDGRKHEIINQRDIFAWLKESDSNTVERNQPLTDTEQLEEIIIMGLRLVDGVSIDELKAKIPSELIDKLFTRVPFLKQRGLVLDNDDKIQLTNDGLLKLNSVVEYLCDTLGEK